jgi:oligo-1,6-glucosidase
MTRTGPIASSSTSVFHHFRQLIKLRRTYEIVVEGWFELLLSDHEQIWALTRRLGSQLLVMIANCSSETATVPAGSVPDLTAAEVLLTTNGLSTSATYDPGSPGSSLVGQTSVLSESPG